MDKKDSLKDNVDSTITVVKPYVIPLWGVMCKRPLVSVVGAIVATALVVGFFDGGKNGTESQSSAAVAIEDSRVTDSYELDDKVAKEKDEPTGDIHKRGKFAGQRAVELVGDLVMAFRWVPAGEFIMGSPDSEFHRNGHELAHRVKLTQGFWILEAEFTANLIKEIDSELWLLIPPRAKNVRENFLETLMQGAFGGDENYADGYAGFLDSDLRRKYYQKEREMFGIPASFITFTEVKRVCSKLSDRLGATVTLPTEAQWEYACRAGTQGDFGGTGNLDNMGWYSENSKSGGYVVNVYLDAGEVRLHDVCSLAPNAWGIYDMHGNVSEWVLDDYSYDFYYECVLNAKDGIVVDPICELDDNDEMGVLRGSNVEGWASQCRSARRGVQKRSEYGACKGFRVVVIPD